MNFDWPKLSRGLQQIIQATLLCVGTAASGKAALLHYWSLTPALVLKLTSSTRDLMFAVLDGRDL